MTTYHLKTGVEPAPETSCVSNAIQTMHSVGNNISTIYVMSCKHGDDAKIWSFIGKFWRSWNM
jgi:hypothetical protein